MVPLFAFGMVTMILGMRYTVVCYGLCVWVVEAALLMLRVYVYKMIPLTIVHMKLNLRVVSECAPAETVI